ncbi:MAG: HD domain-containing protein [Atopobiaceae bacterium]|nr:HD domain-containing protein [Atopobiaceae bacterium]
MPASHPLPINRCSGELALELSDDIASQVQRNRATGTTSPCACPDEAVLRRDWRERDLATPGRPAFIRDAEKIMHIPAYNRLAGKTQVFSFHANDDLSRRGLHVQLVCRIARDIGRALGLNEDLIEAIALGHDIGHTPFGHAGERFLNEVYHERTGRWFFHNVHSVRVLDVLYGRNLSLQTLDGIICHNGEFEQQVLQISDISSFSEFDAMVQDCWDRGNNAIVKLRPMTLEGCVVRLSDIVAYVGKDRQDALCAGLVCEDDFDDGLGGAYNAWALSAFSTDIIQNSMGKDHIQMSAAAFEELRRAKRENYEKIYLRSEVDGDRSEQVRVLFRRLYERLLRDLEAGDERSPIFVHHIEPLQTWLAPYDKHYEWESDFDLCVVDFIASMTDDYFIEICERLFSEARKLAPRRSYLDELSADWC